MEFGRIVRGFVAVLVVMSTLVSCTQVSETPVPASAPLDARAVQAAELFLARYVEPDGRVVRRDQGGDTVSEGQAYALLIASALGEQAVFDRVWQWTKQHLMQPNGLPAWRIDASGKIPDKQSASDADLLIAWALLRDRGPNQDEHHAAGLAMAEAVLKQEVATSTANVPVLVAGPWAVNKRVTNVSYWSSAVFEQLAAITGAPTWSAMAQEVSPLLGNLTRGGSQLPPDWARLEGNSLQASPSPQGVGSSPSARPQYGLDAQRTVVWSAVSCQPAEVAQAASWYRILREQRQSGATSLTLTGEIVDAGIHPVPLVAASAAAHAAASEAASNWFMTKAEDVYRENPTFFGAAWIALGRLLLDTDVLDLCGD